MGTIDVFSTPITYNYKCKICSLSVIIVFVCIFFSLVTPFVFIHNAGGFWMRNRMSVERADISFVYKYLLIAETGTSQPIICSSFAVYKENVVPDNCTVIKVREIDLNNDGRKDILQYQAEFFTILPIKTIKLVLFFNYVFEEVFRTNVDTVAVWDCSLNLEVQKVQFVADLELKQRGLLRNNGLYQLYNDSIDIKDKTLFEFLTHNVHKKFSAVVANPQITWDTGFSKDQIFTIKGELIYNENFINYQTDKWEELKWLWVQYFSFIFILISLVKYILQFLFYKRYLNSYVVVPWRF